MMLPKKEKMSALLAHQLIEERMPFTFSFCTVYDFLLPSLRVFNSTTRCFLCTHTQHTHSLLSHCIYIHPHSHLPLSSLNPPLLSLIRAYHIQLTNKLFQPLSSLSLCHRIYITYNKQHCYTPIY